MSCVDEFEGEFLGFLWSVEGSESDSEEFGIIDVCFLYLRGAED